MNNIYSTDANVHLTFSCVNISYEGNFKLHTGGYIKYHMQALAASWLLMRSHSLRLFSALVSDAG